MKGKMTDYKNEIGKVYGKFTVLDIVIKEYKYNIYQYRCLCECGNITNIHANKVRTGVIKNCCKCNPMNKKHGMSYKSEYHIWSQMNQRCASEKHLAYSMYGGRGITVSDEWKESFDKFLSDMGPRPSKKYSIDRINNDEGYSKDNCKWATRYEQGNNRTNSVFIRFNNEIKTISQWAEHFNISYGKLYCRYYNSRTRYKSTKNLVNYLRELKKAIN